MSLKDFKRDADPVQAARLAAEKMRAAGNMARIMDRYLKHVRTPDNK